MKASPLSKAHEVPAGAEAHTLRVLQCYQLAHLAARIPTRALLEAIDRADAAGALLDPTLYRAKHAAMREDRRVVEAVHALAELGRGLAAEPAGGEGRTA